VAVADARSTAEDTTLNGTTVLANDSDVHGGAPSENNVPLTAELAADVQHGTLTLNTDGTFTYTPAADFNGTDSFTYRALDALGGKSDVVTVTLTVTSVNDEPLAVADARTTAEDTPLSGTTVLANDSDVHGGAPARTTCR